MRRVFADPAVMDLLDRKRVEVIPALPSLALGNDEVSLLEDLQMLHHGAAVHIGKSIAQCARRLGCFLQPIEHLAPPRMGQGLENMVVLGFG